MSGYNLSEKAERAIKIISDMGYGGEILAEYLVNTVENLEPAVDGSNINVDGFVMKKAAEMILLAETLIDEMIEVVDDDDE